MKTCMREPSDSDAEYLNMSSLMMNYLPRLNRTMSSHTKKILCWIAAALPALVTVYLVYQYSVDLPFNDDWALAVRIEKIYNHSFSFNDLFAQQNAHRIFFPLLLLLPTAVLSKWNIFYWLALNLIFAIGTFLLFAYQIKDTKKQLGDNTANLLIPVVSILVFSLKQFINWLFGIQLIVFMSVFFVVAGIVLLSKNPFNSKYFILAAISGVMATFSFANGILFWPLGVIIILLAPDTGFKQKSKYAFSWLVITAATVFMFYYQYNTSQELSPSLSWYILTRFVFFVFSYLGNPLAPVQYLSDPLIPSSLYIPYVTFLLGVLGLIILCYIIYNMVFFLVQQKRMPLQTMVPYFCFCLYALLSSLIIAFGRVALLGYKESLAARYVTHANLFWIGILSLIYFAWRSTGDETEPRAERTGRRYTRQYVFIFLFLIVSGLSFAASYYSQEDFFKLRDVQEDLRLHFIGMKEDEYCPPEWPNYKIYNEALSIMRKRRLSIYRESAGEGLKPEKKHRR
jgi:hypothetical protein